MTTRGFVVGALALAAMAVSASAEAQPARQQRGAGLPPADQPVIQKIPQPSRLSVEGGAGVLGFVGGIGTLGPTWNVRVTGVVTPRWDLEANYLGAANTRADTRESLVMTSIDAGVRYNITLPNQFPVQAYVVGGAGYANFAGKHGDAATLVIPVSAGAERMLTRNIKVGARFQYRPAFFDNLASPITPVGEKPGADTWSLLANVGGGF
jgi:hypothetical protein